MAQATTVIHSITRDISEVNTAASDLSTSSGVQESAVDLSKLAEQIQMTVKQFKI